MPSFQVQTVASEVIWQKEDRVLHKVTLNVNGKTAAVKTWSAAIAKVGFTGTVETYEKTNQQGNIETFVKQPQQAQGQGGGYRSGGGGGYQRNSQPQSQYTMYLSYAKDVAVALINQGKTFGEAELLFELKKIVAGGNFLFEQRPENPSKPALPAQTPVNEPTASDLSAAFGNSDGYQVLGEEESPLWESDNQNPLTPTNPSLPL